MASANVSARVYELLEALKKEFDEVSRKSQSSEHHKDDFDYKGIISSQIQEIALMKQTVMDLEMQQNKVKERYEDEIARLKNQLENRRKEIASGNLFGRRKSSVSVGKPNLSESTKPTISANGISGSAPTSLRSPAVDSDGTALAPLQLPNSELASQGYPGSMVNPSIVGGLDGSSVRSYPQSLPLGHPPAPESAYASSGPLGVAGANGKMNVNPPLPSEMIPTSSLTNNEEKDWSMSTLRKDKQSPISVRLLHTLEHTSVICYVRFSADGKYLATGCNRAAMVFSVETGQLVNLLQEESAEREGDLYVRSVAFSPDGKFLATGVEDRQIRVWDISQKRVYRLLTGHEQEIYSLDFSKDGKTLISGSGDRTICLWDVEAGEQKLILHTDDGVTTVAFSPDNQYIVAGSLDKVIRVWTASGTLIEQLVGHQESVYSICFSPDGSHLVSGSLDNTIRLWELQATRRIPPSAIKEGGICKQVFSGHKDFILSVAMSPDGKWIISGSKDRTIQFWSMDSPTSQLTLQGHNNSVISVAISPNGHTFATGSGDLRARIWSYTDL
ncbi:transcriptional corepressor Tup12 [Schizosaccharomyces osmophilus]|uniref:Transcriptional corepressor Tup12 n=1 Tax=Schizosaccharomyces osmophilus TaxID=2545709 RepID=A0AAE9W892_9SCHI|nr:transcriptional corepressor Tup12 [Schizosaccharomyces osmophilus]WBW71218.1 transcriptional corepressor Tup12 [Schizosaccharomyces osmophilus]